MWLWLFVISGSLLALVLFGTSIYEELKSWQTLVAGIVGFGGIAWVTYTNAQLTRQRDTDLAAEAARAASVQAAEQVASMAMAVGWELAHTAREVVTVRRRLVEIIETRSKPVPRPSAVLVAARNQLRNIPQPRVFAETVGKLVLPAAAIARLAGFYYEMAELGNMADSDLASAFDEDDLHRVADRLRLTVDSANGALAALRTICGETDFPHQFQA
jgi:hypothetical protein